IDFRAVIEGYSHREEGCMFCAMEADRVLLENALALAFVDRFPVTEGHTLVIPKRHVESYFELGRPEVNACNELLEATRTKLEKDDPTVTGFNIGVNAGTSAGQTIPHCHIHLIPRRDGDVATPEGGVRHVIPGKGYYF
ncbi:MAG TPA: HIT domain-containing protein, partial [Isosphaeraceae bacterium]|nr:HIT domain-containing protein [Isosphaeraceae bacterium]